MVGFVGGDDAAVGAKACVVKQAKVVAGVVDGGGDEDGGAPVVV